MAVFQAFRRPAVRALVPWLIAIACVHGLLSAIRWPQVYALSHMVIDYHFGFGKRGLLGALLHFIDHPPYHYTTLAAMAFAVFGLWVGLVAFAGWRYMRADTGMAAAYILFFLSAGFASLVCDIGRGEHYGLLAAAICVLLPKGPIWLLVRALILIVAVLILEANFLIVGPVVAFDVLAGRRRFVAWLSAALVIMPAAGLTWYLGNCRTACNNPAALPYFQSLVADFAFQQIPLATLCVDGAKNLRLAAHEMWSVPASIAALPLSLIVAMPSTVLNLWLLAGVVQRRRSLFLLGVMTVFSPMLLLLVAVDIVRFTTLIQAISLLVLVSAVRRMGLPAQGMLPSSPATPAALVGLAAFEVGCSATLNDGSAMLKFPFMPLVTRAIDILAGHAHFVVIPSS